MPEISQEELDQIKNDLRILKFQQQEAQDTLESGITSHNLASFRNTYVINAQDSLDASYPMYVHFNIINEMIKIVSVKVSFWILNYRAYSKGGQAASFYTGVQAAQSLDAGTAANVYPGWISTGGDVGAEDISTVVKTIKVVNHKHYIGDHSHTAVYGIYEEDTSPKIKFYISENEGVSYNDTFFGGYDTNKKDLEITSLLTGAGSKLIKFESTTRARLSVQIEIKIDISAR